MAKIREAIRGKWGDRGLCAIGLATERVSAMSSSAFLPRLILSSLLQQPNLQNCLHNVRQGSSDSLAFYALELARDASFVNTDRDTQPAAASQSRLAVSASFFRPEHHHLRTTPPPQFSDSSFPKGMSSRPHHWALESPAVRRSFDPVSGASQACRARIYCGQLLAPSGG